MEYNTLGNTGLRVSVAGLGSGGHSRLGISQGRSEAEAEAIVRAALERGVNLLDTAEGYGTEPVIGRAIRGRRREDVVICTKKGVRRQEGLLSPEEMRRGVEASLERLGTDYVDVFYLHGLNVNDYEYALHEMRPVLETARQQGKIRHIGITEAFAPDPSHLALQRAVQDDCWEVFMVGFNLLNQSARERVIAPSKAKGIGITNMFAVRRALSRPEALQETLQKLFDNGQLQETDFDGEKPLDFLLSQGGAQSLTDAAYRFCRYEPGIDVVLFGTGNQEHLEQNVASLLRPPLAPAAVEKAKRMFAGVDSVSGN